jgi:hypothetical protein
LEIGKVLWWLLGALLLIAGCICNDNYTRPTNGRFIRESHYCYSDCPFLTDGEVMVLEGIIFCLNPSFRWISLWLA